MLVQQFLEQSAERFPDKIALICEGQRLTYGQLDQTADRLANALRAEGIQRGDRIAICLNNSSEAVIGIFAALKAGGTFLVINPTTKADKLCYILNNSGAVVLLAQAQSFAPRLTTKLKKLPHLRLIISCGGSAEPAPDWDKPRALVEILEGSAPGRSALHNVDLDLACLIYTSGTTGEPKGVMSDHGNVVFAASSIIEYLQNQESDIVLNVLPLSFDYGLYQLLMTFKFGGTLVLERSFAYPAIILERLQLERVTGFPGVPTIFSMLVQMDLSAYDFSSLRYITNTAAALPPSHLEGLRQKFPHVRLYSMYGLTETKRTLYLPPEWLDRKPGSVGIAIPGTKVWLEDEQGNRVGPDQTGELVACGPHVMRGYWDAPEASAERFRPGPLPGERVCHTGDLFRMDQDGFMYFIGRRDDMIKCRGEKVAPKEVENVLHALAGVVEAAVLGVADPILGQSIKAFLVRSDHGLTATAVLAHCRAHLEDFMVPKQIEFRESLPKSPSGKVKKDELA